jgi:hypothetical protein
MVPGMTERERLAGDVQRLEWLADAVRGPTQLPRLSSPPTVPSGTRRFIPLGVYGRSFALMHELGRRLRTIRPKTVWSLLREAPGREIA